MVVDTIDVGLQELLLKDCQRMTSTCKSNDMTVIAAAAAAAAAGTGEDSSTLEDQLAAILPSRSNDCFRLLAPSMDDQINLVNQIYNTQGGLHSSAQQSTDTFGNPGHTKTPLPGTPTSSRGAPARRSSVQAMLTLDAGGESDVYSLYSEPEVVGVDRKSIVMGRFGGPSLTSVDEVPNELDAAAISTSLRNTIWNHSVLPLSSHNMKTVLSQSDLMEETSKQDPSAIICQWKKLPRTYSAAKLRKESFYPEDHEEEGFTYRRSGLQSDLADWAPSAKPSSESWAGIKHLPDLSKISGNEPTSKPIVDVRKDLEWSMQRLLTERAFEKLISNPVGRHVFREYLVQEIPGSEHQLDMYFDLCQYVKQSDAISLASEGLYDIYLAQGSSPEIVTTIPKELPNNLYSILKSHSEIKASLGPMQQHLLQSLHKYEFQLFVKAQLVEHNKMKLVGSNFFGNDGNDGNDNSTETTGLGDCYCLTNPRLKENPIILVSPGFERVTGYPQNQIIGRNCRFLQGPGSAPESIQRIRNAINKGQVCTDLLLNYRLDGTPFLCLLTIIPIRDSMGNLVYFIGGQTNVSGQFIGSKGLRFLTQVEDDGTSSLASSNIGNGYEVSPTLARYLQSDAESVSEDSLSGGGSGGLGSCSSHSVNTNGSSSNSSQERRRGVIPLNLYESVNSGDSRSTTSLSDENKKKPSRFAMAKLFTLPSKQDYSKITSPLLSKTGLGAESTMRKEAYNLEDQMEYFSNIYSKLIIFLQAKREIIFATRDCLKFFNLPIETMENMYASPLVHADLISIVQGSSKVETRAVQKAIQAAIRNGESISIRTGVKRVGILTKKSSTILGSSSALAKWGEAKEKIRFTTLHITPLRDRDNSSLAFVAALA